MCIWDEEGLRLDPYPGVGRVHAHPHTCMHTHVHIDMTCTHVHMWTHHMHTAPMHMHAHTCELMHTHAHSHVHTCTHCTHMHAHSHVLMYMHSARLDAHVHVCTCIRDHRLTNCHLQLPYNTCPGATPRTSPRRRPEGRSLRKGDGIGHERAGSWKLKFGISAANATLPFPPSSEKQGHSPNTCFEG